MNDLLSQSRKASDMAASAVLPASTVTTGYIEGLANGEPYLLKCTANANRIIVFLHSWSSTYQSVQTHFPELANLDRACIVAPNFGGPNTTPEAMGSDDTIERINTVLQEVQYKTGLSRIYLAAYSGGTLAALNYMGKYPAKIHRASLWLMISDLASLYATTQDQQLKDNMLAVIGHAPTGADDPDYLARSPRARLVNAKGPTTVFINVGQQDVSTPMAQGVAARDQLLTRPDFEVVYKEWPIGHEFNSAQRYEAVKQLILE